MDRDHLTRLIDEPARVQRDDIADLKAMAERYPWFSGAHLLLAVGGHREGDVLFDEQLRASAAHLPSRSVLFDALNAPLPVAPAIPGLVKEPVARQMPTDPPVEPAPTIPVETISTPGPEPLEVAPPVVPEPVQELLPAVEPLEAAASPGSVAPAETLPAAPPLSEHIPTPWKERLLRGDRDEEELDRQMRDSAVAISYELLLESEGLLEPTTEQPAPVPVAEPPTEVRPVITEVKPPVRAARSFSDWLTETPTEPSTAAPSPSSIPRPPVVAPVDPEIVRAVQQSGPVPSKHTPETPETKALIERFLQQNSSTAAPLKKTEFFNPQTAAKRSLDEHADLVTETLARIYEKQGNIAKAIAAYERLAVKHPEKSAHFRALAKALSGR